MRLRDQALALLGVGARWLAGKDAEEIEQVLRSKGITKIGGMHVQAAARLVAEQIEQRLQKGDSE